MAVKKKASNKKKTQLRKRNGTRRRLTPRKDKRGLQAADTVLAVEAPEVAQLVAEVKNAGGAAIGAYREPLSGRPLLLATLPLAAVQPTPFQRDLSPTHTKRLAAKIEEAASFLDPIVVVRGQDGRLWTPNGRHRLAAAKVLGLRQITALISPDEDLAFRILALNTEKAHNLKEKSLEVIRMARSLAAIPADPPSKETDFALEFEEPALLTVGICYEKRPRFSGGAYNPILRRCEVFSDDPLADSIAAREARADKILELDDLVAEVVKALKARGFDSPYVKTFVVARVNPLKGRGDQKPIDEVLDTMLEKIKAFDPSSVKEDEIGAGGGGYSGEGDED